MDIKDMAANLVAAINIIMDPKVSHEERSHALKICEDVKENSPLCAQCGLLLASRSYSPTVRHFGLQLIEHCIRFRWNTLSHESKIFIKVNTMELLSVGMANVLQEEPYIKDGLSRIVVEMIKREWPQQWPTLLQELHALCVKGPTLQELVLLIFLRLAEDIVTFQNVQSQRRRELYQSLLANLKDIFTFFIHTLKEEFNVYSQMKARQNPREQEMAKVHCRVAETSLKALAGFVEWSPVCHITGEHDVLLKNLLTLLLDPNLQLQAAECLLLIANRKGRLEERRPLMVLYSERFKPSIFDIARTAATSVLDESGYMFLKKLGQTLTGMGTHICSLWGTEEDPGLPETFPLYLDTVLLFSKHDSQMLSNYTQSLWGAFYRHPHVSQCDAIQAMLTKVVESCMDKLVKVGFPSRNDNPSCFYARFDFDSDEDFISFFARFRAEVADTVRYATLLNPMATFQLAAQWLHLLLNQPVKPEDSETGLCNLSSPAYLQWDAMTIFLENVISRMVNSPKMKSLTPEGIALLNAVLFYDTQDPLILSSVLSCISSLFIFLTLEPKSLKPVLDKIFSSVVFSLPGQTKSTRTKAVKNVRRHACSSLVKICKQYPGLLLPAFDQLYLHVKNLCDDPNQLSQMEKCTLMEALVLISNEFNDYDKQSAFLQEILMPVSTMWLSAELEQTFSSAESYMSHIGLDRPPVEPSAEDTMGINRSQIIFCVNTTLAVIKRSKWPSDREVAEKGGFFRPGSSQSASATLRNPVMPHVKPLLERLLLFIRAQNGLWHPHIRQKVHPKLINAYDMFEVEKTNLLGIPQPQPSIDVMETPTAKNPLERMRHFLSTVHDGCYHTLGNAGFSIGADYYEIPGLGKAILSSIFPDLEFMPDYRMRPIIRVFIKQFIQNCPEEMKETTLIPVLEALCPMMFQRLSNKWQIFRQRYGSSIKYEEEMTEVQEILEDQLNRTLTREYIDTISVLILNRPTLEPDAMDEDVEDKQRHPQAEASLSEFGITVLKTETICASLVMTLFSALHWLDTTTSLKSIHLCFPVLKQLLAKNIIRQSEEAVYLLQSTLIALQELGEHEVNQSLLIGLSLQVYEALRPRYSGIADLMLQVPGCRPDMLQDFDEKLSQAMRGKQLSERRKKDMFKNLVSNIIGRNVGQQFSRTVFIKNLPPLFQRSKKESDLLNTDEKAGICELFVIDRRKGGSC